MLGEAFLLGLIGELDQITLLSGLSALFRNEKDSCFLDCILTDEDDMTPLRLRYHPFASLFLIS